MQGSSVRRQTRPEDCCVEIVFFDPNESVRCKVRLTDWMEAAFATSHGAGAKEEACALKKVRDLCDRLIAARNKEQTAIVNTAGNTKKSKRARK